MYSLFVTAKRDFLIACRHKTELLVPLCFFFLATTLFPLAVTSDAKTLNLMGPGVIWISALLANLLALDSLFVSDYEDGTLEQIIISPSSLSSQLVGKLVTHWLLASLPLIVSCMVVSTFYYLEIQSVIVLILSLLLGSPVLTVIGSIGSSLTLGARQRGMLLILLVTPLYIPVLIFGTSAVNHAANHLPFSSQLLFLAALLLFSITFAPFLLAQTIRLSVE